MRPERRQGPHISDNQLKSGTWPLQIGAQGHTLPPWVYTLSAAAAIIGVCWQSLRLLRSRGRAFEMDFTLALRSGAIFILLMVPLTYPELQNVSESIQTVYIWLPLWYMSMLKKSLGGWIQISMNASIGTILALLVVIVLCKSAPSNPGDFYDSKCLLLAFLIAYVVCLSGADADMKKMFLGTLSPLFVTYLSNASALGAIMNQDRINWTSMILCYAYLTLTALALSAMTLLLRAPYCLSSSLLASDNTAEDLAEISENTWRSLQLLLKYFQRRPSDFDLETLGQHLQLLKINSLHLESQLAEARWEAFRWHQHRRLRGLLHLLMCHHSVLLAALAWLRSPFTQGQQAELAPFLNEFGSATGAVLRSVSAPWWLRQNTEDQEASVIDALEHAELADGSLLACLESLRDRARPESTTPSGALQPAAAFVEILRQIPKAMKDFLLNKVDVDQPSIESQWLMGQPWLKRSYRRQAIGYSLAWVASLVWCISYRNGSATCAILVAWLLPFNWVTLRGTMNELIGTTGGVILGGLPVFVMKFSPTFRTTQHPGLHELFVCFTLMYLLWTIATYFAQVQAFQWRVAALFWSCFGGVEMLRDFGLAEDFRSYVWKQHSWDSLVDLSVGCGMVFCSELFMCALCREVSAKRKAAYATADCLQTAAKLTGSMQDSDGYLMRGQATELLTRVSQQQEQMQDLQLSLAKSIMEARFWSLESLHCIRFWDIPWRHAMISRILDQCDVILLATRTIAWSSERFGGPGPSALMLKALVPPELPPRLHHCSEVCLQALHQHLPKEQWTLTEAPPLALAKPPSEASDLTAAAAASAMRGSVHVMADALLSIEGALMAEEVLAFSSWTPASNKFRKMQAARDSNVSEMA